MATGFPVKANYATGDVLTAANMNDLAGTLNYLDPTAKGDLFPASDGSTLTRLAVGTNGQILTADSTQTTGMKWAAAAGGGMTDIASGTLSSAALSLTFISGSYNRLFLVINNAQLASANDINFRFNSDSGTNYMNCRMSTDQTGSGSAGSGASATSLGANASSVKGTTAYASFILDLPNYTGNSWKVANVNFLYMNNTSSYWITGINTGGWMSNSAITGISTTNSFSSASYTLYGVK